MIELDKEEIVLFLTKNEYNYLLPIKHIKKKMLSRENQYTFYGNNEEIKDVKLRLKGLYW